MCFSILEYIINFTNYALIDLTMFFDNIEFSLFDVIKYHMLLFVLAYGIFAIYHSFMRKYGGG